MAVVTIFGNEVGHNLDSFASSLGALKSDVDEATVVDNTSGVDKFFLASPSRLGDGELMFVHVAHYLVGLFFFRNETPVLVGVPIAYFAHRARFVSGSRDELKRTVKSVSVGRVSDKSRAVDCGLSTSKQACTSLCFACVAQYCRKGKADSN